MSDRLGWMNRLLPVVILFFLAPAIAELLSGSSPPAEFFNPFAFVVLTALYGGGAVLARELTIGWGKGWASLFALGAAFGIIEEGLMVKSFFDPNWVDLGILGSYGRWAGVNWVWSVQLTIFHSAVSIAIPVLLTELMFPARHNEPWLGRRGLIGLLGIFWADVAFGNMLLTAYRPSAAVLVPTAVVALGLVILAWCLPRQPFAAKDLAVPRSFWFWLTGFLGTLAFFLVFWGLPHSTLPPVLAILIGVGEVGLVFCVVMKMSGNGAAWSGVHRLALAAGCLSLFILLAPIQEFDVTRVDNTAGMTVVGVAALVLLLWLRRRVKED